MTDVACVRARVADVCLWQLLDGAQFGLGWMHENGEGVTKDAAEALRWYRMAADQGHPGACDKVARFYDGGLGVAEDKAEAVRWFKRAVKAGFTHAETDLVRLGAHGAAGLEQAAAAAAAAAPLPRVQDKAVQVLPSVAHRSSARANAAALKGGLQ